jgi:hypothetical protein
VGKEDLNPEFTRCVEKGKIVTFAKEGAENLIRAAEDFRDSAGKLVKK